MKRVALSLALVAVLGQLILPPMAMAERIPGDCNLDGVVDFTDFLILAPNYETEGDWEDGDFEGDGWVGDFDFAELQSTFGGSESDWDP